MHGQSLNTNATSASIHMHHMELCRISCLAAWPALPHILLTLCNMRDVLSDDLLDKLCNYVFTALTIISLTLEKKEFGHGGEQGVWARW